MACIGVRVDDGTRKKLEARAQRKSKETGMPVPLSFVVRTLLEKHA